MRNIARRGFSEWLILIGTGVACLSPHILCAETAPASSDPRALWVSSRITGSPDPPLPYKTERVFPALTFVECLDLTVAPNIDRLFVVEQRGKILSFPNSPDVQSADLVVDLAKEIPGVEQVYALAFHPDFEQNRYCYVCYILANELPNGTHVARFRMTDTEPPRIDVASEQTILTWWSGGHNGCCLKFGPDGYLYISTGDGSDPNPPDTLRAGQDVTNLLSAILRIDVDHRDGSMNYRIPPDNPFINLEGARGEIWAYGLRNPWRMSFDSKTGDLWVGDVGWELWEMLNCIQRGGNYGWSVLEGRQPANPEWERGPTPILTPTIEQPHSESSSITDGLTYYGSRLNDLYGHHVYGDYDTGKIWGFRYVDGKVIEHRELADSTLRIAGFGEDHDGELYVLDHSAGSIHRLVPNIGRSDGHPFPRSLSQSGLFVSVADHEPAPGVLPYSIIAEPWADGARAERFVAVPNDGVITRGNIALTFPKDSVLFKTLSLEMEPGNAASRRRIETQLLHFNGLDWKAYSYQWNDDQTDAVLLDSAGSERTFDMVDRSAPGGRRQQVWRFSGRGECQRCHNSWSGPPLAFNALQLGSPLEEGGSASTQLDRFQQLGLIDSAVRPDLRHRLVSPDDPTADLDARARTYLHVNCAHCHRLHAGSAVLSKMSCDLDLSDTDMVGVRPTQGTFGIHAANVIAPGDPHRSVLLYRMTKSGSGRMPHVGSSVIDRAGVDLIEEWIRSIPTTLAADLTGSDAAVRLRAQETAWLEQLQGTTAGDESGELIRQLLSSTSGALMLLRSVDADDLDPSTVPQVIELASQHTDISVRDLFERFLPAEQRIKRLGSVIHPLSILSKQGDAERGRAVFFETAGIQCKNCHRIHDQGLNIGPELTTIRRKYDRAQLLESMLDPSKFIDPKYVTHLLETTDGRVLTGLLVSKDDAGVTLVDAQNQQLRVASKDVEKLVAQPQSLMPDLLLRDMTAQQVADLLSFLETLK